MIKTTYRKHDKRIRSVDIKVQDYSSYSGYPQPYINYENGAFSALSIDCWNEVFEQLNVSDLRYLANIMLEDADRIEKQVDKK